MPMPDMQHVNLAGGTLTGARSDRARPPRHSFAAGRSRRVRSRSALAGRAFSLTLVNLPGFHGSPPIAPGIDNYADRVAANLRGRRLAARHDRRCQRVRRHDRGRDGHSSWRQIRPAGAERRGSRVPARRAQSVRDDGGQGCSRRHRLGRRHFGEPRLSPSLSCRASRRDRRASQSAARRRTRGLHRGLSHVDADRSRRATRSHPQPDSRDLRRTRCGDSAGPVPTVGRSHPRGEIHGAPRLRPLPAA